MIAHRKTDLCPQTDLMKKIDSPGRIPSPATLAALSALVLLAGFGATRAVADTVYVTGCVSNCVSTTTCGSQANSDLNPNNGARVFNDNSLSSYTSAKASGSAVADKPATPGSRYFSNAFSNSTPVFGVVLSPALAVPGAAYR